MSLNTAAATSKKPSEKLIRRALEEYDKEAKTIRLANIHDYIRLHSAASFLYNVFGNFIA